MKRFGKLSFTEALVLIETRLCEAASTLRLIRLVRHDLPDKFTSAWPDVVHDWNAYGGALAKFRTEHALNSAPIPGPDEIDRMDMALRWLWAVQLGDRPIVMGRAEGYSWRVLEDRDGRCTRTLQHVHSGALEAILASMMEAA